MNQPRTSLVMIFGNEEDVTYCKQEALSRGLIAVEESEIDSVITRVKKSSPKFSALETDPTETLQQMLTDLAPRIFTTERYLPMEGFPPYKVFCPKGMAGRAIRSTNRNNRDKAFDKRMILSVPAIKYWCTENGVNYRDFRDGLLQTGVLIDSSTRFTLGKGTTFTTKQQCCWILDLQMIQGENDEPTQD